MSQLDRGAERPSGRGRRAVDVEVRGDARNLGLQTNHHVGIRRPGARKRARGQGRKSTRWMPWHQEAKKDAATCEKLRGTGSECRSVDIRMGKPGGRHGPSSSAEYIGGRKRTEGTETSKYLQEKKSNETPRVVASERGKAQTSRIPAGVVGARRGTVRASRMAWEGQP